MRFDPKITEGDLVRTFHFTTLRGSDKYMYKRVGEIFIGHLDKSKTRFRKMHHTNDDGTKQEGYYLVAEYRIERDFIKCRKINKRLTV